jgi:hypothetical protein
VHFQIRFKVKLRGKEKVLTALIITLQLHPCGYLKIIQFEISLHRRPNRFRERSFVTILLRLPKKHLDSVVIRRLVWYRVMRYVTMASYYELLHWHHPMTCYNDIMLRVVALVSIYMLQWDRVICHNDPMLRDMSRRVHVMKYVAVTECYGVARDYTVLWCMLRNFTITSLYVTTKSTVCDIVLRRTQEIKWRV